MMCRELLELEKHLSHRAAIRLFESGIDSIETLKTASEITILKIPGIGIKTFREIQKIKDEHADCKCCGLH